VGYLVKTPDLLKPLAGHLIWSLDQYSKEIFLTFDDGPTPHITYEVLDILDKFDAKATFFCIGGNVKALPEVYAEILHRGHKTGNHTWNHMSGWSYSDYSYFKNILECSQLVKSNLFRPPYGQITPRQVRSLKSKYKIVMWDVLSGDWDKNVSPDQCLNNVIKNTRGGSIIVFHDSKKAKTNMLYALQKSLDKLCADGYKFSVIPN
jgi:peptidoglycan/xylan/chitin deacetylase (PgdA/CDA1 family)